MSAVYNITVKSIKAFTAMFFCQLPSLRNNTPTIQKKNCAIILAWWIEDHDWKLAHSWSLQLSEISLLLHSASEWSSPSFFVVDKNGDVCISILHEPGEDKYGYEKPEERWLPIHTVETIMISVISMLADPNGDSPANVDAAVWLLQIKMLLSLLKEIRNSFESLTNRFLL